MEFKRKFAKELNILSSLFSNPDVSELEKIFNATEDWWTQNLERLPSHKVSYLVIAEAPPAPTGSEIRYVYNPKSSINGARGLLQGIYLGLFPDRTYDALREQSYEQTLQELGEKGLLIVDSLPFAMDYSDSTKTRSEPAYCELVKTCCESYLLPKLHESGIDWSDKTKVGFSLKLNARNVIDSLGGTLDLRINGTAIQVGEDNIVTDASNYPGKREVRRVFGLYHG
jgi:hypothetical protein